MTSEEIINKFKDTKVEIPCPYNMGLGKLAGPIVLKRQFRWIVEIPSEDDISHWFHKVKVDFKEKILHLKVYDDCNNQIFRWLENFNKDISSRIITIKDLDGCGNTISTTEYRGCEIIKNQIVYKYNKSDCTMFDLKIKYKICVRKK